MTKTIKTYDIILLGDYMNKKLTEEVIVDKIIDCDGNIVRDFPVDAKPVIHGDAISPSIAAASILAKVTRDRLCIEMDRQFPQYKIAKHKGYGTREHMELLRLHGPEPTIYRKKFIRFLDK